MAKSRIPGTTRWFDAILIRWIEDKGKFMVGPANYDFYDGSWGWEYIQSYDVSATYSAHAAFGRWLTLREETGCDRVIGDLREIYKRRGLDDGEEPHTWDAHVV